MKKLLSLLALLLVLVGCSANAQDKTLYYYSRSAPDTFNIDEDNSIAFDNLSIRELTREEENAFSLRVFPTLKKDKLNQDWVLYEIEITSNLDQIRIDFMEQFKPVVIDGYTEVYSATHYRISDDGNYHVLLPKELMKTEQLQLKLTDTIFMDLNFDSRADFR